jgi:hypothetical protein
VESTVASKSFASRRLRPIHAKNRSTRRQPLGGNHRRPERQDHRGRRTTRLRCWKEDQRTQAPCARGHRRAQPRARTASGEYPRPRWWRTASASLAVHLPVYTARLRRQRICRGKTNWPSFTRPIHRGHDRKCDCRSFTQHTVFAELFFAEARVAIGEADVDNGGLQALLLRQAETYCLGTITNLLGEDRLTTVPRVTLDYDFEAWLDDLDGRPLNQFAWPLPRRVGFALTEEQFTLVESALDKFGRHDLGRGKALIRINPNVLWRRPMVDAR